MFRVLRDLRLGVKVSLLGIVSVLTTAVALVALAVWQTGLYGALAQREAESLMQGDLDHIALGVYNLIRTENDAAQQQVNSSLNVARHVLFSAGRIGLAAEKVGWRVRDQFSNAVKDIELPKMLVGNKWLGQNSEFQTETPIVDTLSKLTGESATIFQRMNEDGDMLRVATTVRTSEGKRAIGTYIPARMKDGTPNPVTAAILTGKTYRGRAYVVNAWYLTAYEPITDESGVLIGMLYVGVEQKAVEDRVRQAVLQTKVGKTGYVYVVGGRGEERGRYIISRNGERDGENIWQEQDVDGRYVIQEIVNKATSAAPGQLKTERYRWCNPGESTARWKIARLSYFEPWDWVIGTSAYVDELDRDQAALAVGRDRMIGVMCVAGLGIALAIAALGMVVAWSIVRPIQNMTRAVENFTQGGFSGAIPVHSRDEVGALARAFNAMMSALEKTMAGLRASEEKYRVIVENAVEGIFLSTLQGKLISVNSALARITGYRDPADVVRDFPDLPRDLFAELEGGWERASHTLLEEEASGYEVQFRRGDGPRIWVSLGIGAIHDDHGRRSMIQGFVTDITYRKQAEEALRLREADLVRAQAIAHLGNWSWDLVSKTASWSEELYRIFGVDEASFVPTRDTITRVVHPDDLAMYRRNLIAASSGTPTEPFECRLTRPNGEHRVVLLSEIEVERDESGKPIRLFGALLDITERKRAEDELRHANMVVESSPVVLFRWLATAGWPVDIVSRNVSQFGYSRDEFLSGAVLYASIIYSDDMERVTAEIARYAESGANHFQQEYRIVTKDGVVRWIEDHTTVIRDADGKVTHFLGTIADISERKHSELERQRLEEQLAQAQKMESIGRLAGGVAHDFNNILMVIMGYGELVLEGLPPESRPRDAMLEVIKAGERARDLTRQLLAFSRKQVLDVRVLDLHSVILGVEKMIRRLLGEDIEVRILLGADKASVRADVAQLEQVLVNLCVNARDAMPDGGALSIETGIAAVNEYYAQTHLTVPFGEYVVLSISDTGYGMDEATRKRIFDPFFTTKDKGKGTGLGLATVYGIVKQHGGEITVYSEIGVGTTFRVYLPHADADVSDKADGTEIALPGFGESILVVEDEEAVRKMVCQMLERLGYNVVEAESVEQCVDYVSSPLKD